MWADRVTVRKGMGCLFYFIVTGVQLTLSLDIIEAIWLVRYLERMLSRLELIGL